MARFLVAVLQLIRLPNVLTAAADSLAGWMLAGGTLGLAWPWVALCLASMALYAGGMALNDWFDRDVDRRERPHRPIPSCRITAIGAAVIGVSCLGLGLILALASGSTVSLAVAGVLAAAILIYDGGGKKTHAGPFLMGSCRGLNLLLGMSHASALGGPWAWVAAGGFGLFVVGLTWISRSETESGQTRNLIGGLTVQNLALLILAAVALHSQGFPGAWSNRPLVPVEGLLILALVALFVNNAATRGIYHPVPQVLQRAVKTGILSLIWIDVGLVAAVRGPVPALAVAMIWLPAYGLSRWLYTT
jgi:4-hydroxybenzoate polyprenyltransferase